MGGERRKGSDSGLGEQGMGIGHRAWACWGWERCMAGSTGSKCPACLRSIVMFSAAQAPGERSQHLPWGWMGRPRPSAALFVRGNGPGPSTADGRRQGNCLPPFRLSFPGPIPCALSSLLPPQLGPAFRFLTSAPLPPPLAPGNYLAPPLPNRNYRAAAQEAAAKANSKPKQKPSRAGGVKYGRMAWQAGSLGPATSIIELTGAAVKRRLKRANSTAGRD
jgi:hypothetical protein